MGFTRDLVTNGDCGDSEMNPIKQVLTSVFEGKQQTKDIQQEASTTTGSSTTQGMDMSQLTQVQKQKIRDRATLMARHFFHDKSDEYIKQQLEPVLQKVDIAYNTTDMNGSSTTMGSVNASYKMNELDDEEEDEEALYNKVDDDDDEDLDILNEIDYIQLFKDNFDIERVRDRTEAYVPSLPLKDNPYASVANPAEMAKSFFELGDLQKAIQAYEVAVLKEPTNTDHWFALGKAQSHADDDTKAIHAYNEAFKLNPKNLPVIMELGVSYTNELQKIRAFAFLKGWLEAHPKYGDIVANHPSQYDMLPEGPTNMDINEQLKRLNRYKSFDRDVVDMFEKAAERAGDADGDLLGALGTLHNVWENQQRAIAYFEKALVASPQNYTLWNRLGATLANRKQYEQAISCYRQALKLKPNYVRAWVNLGICAMNLENHMESMDYFITALKMHPKAHLVWGYLSIVFTNLDRPDLLELAEKRDLEQLLQLLPKLKQQYKQDGHLQS